MIFTRYIGPDGTGFMTPAHIADAALHVKIFVEANPTHERIRTLTGLHDILTYAKEQVYCAFIS